MQSILVTWSSKAEKYFREHNGTQEEKTRQETLVRTFGINNVQNAKNAKIM
jgi:hypothetical protein